MNDLTPVDPVAMTIFIAFFVLVTVVGFFAARWKRGDLHNFTNGASAAASSAY